MYFVSTQPSATQLTKNKKNDPTRPNPIQPIDGPNPCLCHPTELTLPCTIYIILSLHITAIETEDAAKMTKDGEKQGKRKLNGRTKQTSRKTRLGSLRCYCYQTIGLRIKHKYTEIVHFMLAARHVCRSNFQALLVFLISFISLFISTRFVR